MSLDKIIQDRRNTIKSKLADLKVEKMDRRDAERQKLTEYWDARLAELEWINRKVINNASKTTPFVNNFDKK